MFKNFFVNLNNNYTFRIYTPFRKMEVTTFRFIPSNF